MTDDIPPPMPDIEPGVVRGPGNDSYDIEKAIERFIVNKVTINGFNAESSGFGIDFPVKTTTSVQEQWENLNRNSNDRFVAPNINIEYNEKPPVEKELLIEKSSDSISKEVVMGGLIIEPFDPDVINEGIIQNNLTQINDSVINNTEVSTPISEEYESRIDPVTGEKVEQYEDPSEDDLEVDAMKEGSSHRGVLPVKLTRADGQREVLAHLNTSFVGTVDGKGGREADLPDEDSYYLAGGGSSFEHMWQATLYGFNEDDPPTGLCKVKGGIITIQGARHVVDDEPGLVCGQVGIMCLEVVRDASSRAFESASIKFFAEEPLSTNALEYTVLAEFDLTGIIQCRNDEICSHELMLVENGEFKLMPFQTNSRNSYDPPEPEP